MSKKDPTAATRVALHNDRNKRKGLIQVKVWIPAKDRALIMEIAEKRRESFLAD